MLTPWRIAKYVLLVVIGIIGSIVLFGSWFTVSQTEVAITKTFGKLNDTVYTAGFHWVNPFATTVVFYNIQKNKATATANAASKDLRDVTTEVAVNFNIDPSNVKDIYTNIGNMDSIENKVVDPSIQEVVKAVTSKYTAEELITKRSDVSNDITNGLKEKFAKYYLSVFDVNIINFKFSDQFAQAIERKVEAEQQALTEKNNRDKVQYQADQQVITAKAQAETIKIQAQAVNAQWGADYVKLQWINKWNGVMPATMLGDSSNIMLNLSK